MLFFITIAQLNYSIVIPDSYLIANAIGSGAAYSGQLIGVYKPGSCAGSLITWILLRNRHDIWRTHPRWILAIGLLTSTAGAVLYTALTELVPTNGGDKEETTDLALLFLFARFGTGLGAGLVGQLTFVSVARLTPSSERPDQMARLQLCNTLGIAGGPLADSALRLLELCPDGPLSFQPTGIFQVLALITGLLTLANCHRGLVNAEDFMRTPSCSPSHSFSSAAEELLSDHASPHPSLATPTSSPRSLVDTAANSPSSGPGFTDLEHGSPRVVIVGSIAMTATRAVSMAGVQAAVVLLLQREYAWEESAVGVAVGLTFLTSIPLKMVHSGLRELLEVVGWVRMMALTGLLGSTLLFDTSSSAMLLAATTVVFPTMFLSDALCLGAMQQHCLPDGSWFDANHTTLWFNLSVNGAGHFAGPILARYCVEVGGQSLFALLQLSLCLIFLAIFECVVRPNYAPSTTKGGIRSEVLGPLGRPRLGTM